MASFTESNTDASVGKDSSVILVIAVQRTVHGVECGSLDNNVQTIDVSHHVKQSNIHTNKQSRS